MGLDLFYFVSSNQSTVQKIFFSASSEERFFQAIVITTFNTKGYSDDLKATKMDIIIIGLQPMPMEDVIEIQSGIFSD